MIEAVWVKGLVTESKPGFAKVVLPDMDDIVSPWMPIVKSRAMNDDDNWPVEINEQVMCIIDRGFTEGIILGAISSDVDVPDSDAAVGKWRKKFEDGTYFEYDKNAHTLNINVIGKTSLTITGDGYNISRGEESLTHLFTDLLQALLKATYTNGAGTTSFADNVADFQNISNRIQNLLV